MFCYFINIISADKYKLRGIPGKYQVQQQQNLMNRFGEKFKNGNFGSKNDHKIYSILGKRVFLKYSKPILLNDYFLFRV